MTPQEELQSIIADVKASKWTPELFERIRRLLGYADVFNTLRRELTPEEYDQFDLEYCSYYRPQDREITKWLAEERRKAKNSKNKRKEVKEPRSRQQEAAKPKKNLTRELVSSQILKW